MRFLVFEENVPKIASTGGHVATLAMLSHLQELGDVHLVNVISDPRLSPTPVHDASPAPRVASPDEAMDGEGVTVFDFSSTVAGGILTKLKRVISDEPKMVQELDWAALLQLTQGEIERADRIILGWVRFLNLLHLPRFPVSKSFYIADNVEYQLALSMPSNYRSKWLCQRDSARIEQFEATGVAKVHRAAAFTSRDCDELSRLSGREVALVPPVLPRVTRPEVVREGFALYATNLGHPPNVDALDWLLNAVWPQMPVEAKLVVTGAGDFSAYELKHPNVEFAGFVSRESLYEFYDRCAVVLNPTRMGSGIQIKMLEALSFGCPVVTTTFSNPFGELLAHSDDAVEFAALVASALARPDGKGFDYGAFFEDASQNLERFLELTTES